MKEVNLLWDKIVFGPPLASVSFRFRNLGLGIFLFMQSVMPLYLL